MTSPRPQTRCSVEAGHHAVEHPNDREMLRSYAFDAHGERRRGSPQAAAVDAQGQRGPGFWPAAYGISHSDFEQGEIGPDPFRHACLLGLEGMVSKHRESTYRIKNWHHPAFRTRPSLPGEEKTR